MKINFKKIASVLATTVMLGSTIAFGAAAFPEPFVKSGAADAALIVGASAASSDMAAATNIGDALNADVTSTGGALSGEGDKIKLEKGSTKLNLNEGTSDVWGTSITDSDLPTLLADGAFYNKQNTEYKYEQTFGLGNLTFKMFSDSDYQDKLPTLGFQLASSTYVANYTLDFITDPESTATSGTELTDFENKNINLLGKNYYILDFKNSSSGKLTLLDSADSSTISEGESTTVVVGDKSYDVSIAFISSDEVILSVDGVNTEKLSATGTTYGNTYKMSDGTYVGVKEINVQNYAGGSKTVTFSLGKGKLEITHDSNVKINDKSITDLYGYHYFGTTGGKATWQKTVINWRLSEENFLTSGKELVMPGFEAIKLLMEDTTMPEKVVTEVVASSDYVQLKTEIKGGKLSLPILYLISTTGKINGTGQSATQRLATSNTTTLAYNATSVSSYENDGFIVSWASTRDAESYYLDVSQVRYDADSSRNLTTIRDKITGAEWSDRKTGDQITLGNVVLTVQNVNYTAAGEKDVTFTVNSGGSFNTLYTKDGLKIWLPWLANASQAETGLKDRGGLNLTSVPAAASGNDQNVWTLWMSESDIYGTLDQKAFSLNITNTSSGSTYYTTVSTIGGVGTPYETPTSGSKVWESYVESGLMTKILHDKTSESPAQYSADVEYHGGEVSANVYVAAPSVSSIADAIKVYKDSEVDSVKSKNLVVVGGSCINTVAASLLGSTTPLCGADFSDATTVGAGQYLIQVFASPYNAEKVAMLVAGYDAADTTAAANEVKDGNFADITVGKKSIGPVLA